MIKQKTQYEYEVILIDDGSKDNTLIKVKEYQNKYPKFFKIIHQENQGISVARNRGIEEASGKYICFIDHDDIIMPEFVEVMLTKALEEDADIVKCAYAEIENEQIIVTSSNEVMNISGTMKEELFTSIGYIWGCLYKRKIFEKLRFPSDYWYEDMIGRSLIKRLCKKYIQISECLYYKIRSSENASRKIWSNQNYKCIEQLYLVKEIIEANRNLGLDEDIYFYRCILKECSKIMAGRISGLTRGKRKLIFLGASDLLQELWTPEYKHNLSMHECLWNNSLLRKPFFILDILYKYNI